MIWWVAGVFAAGLAAALVATPLAARFGRACGFMDAPQGRKIHTHPIPRCGGLALVAAFFAAVSVAALASFPQAGRQIETSHVLAVFAGGVFIFLVGLIDDRWPLPAKVKLLAQIAAAAICFYGGVKIESFTLGSAINLDLDFLSFLLTAFWFVLFINAINLIDGLDGLAAGVSFFVCAVQAVLASMRAEALPAMYFAALAGASLGFLRYNFNPASIFLGDGGSYFLGYMVAALSILTSAKSQVGATILMPILAFGVPLLDTITAPLRRFVRGKKLFEPDREHVHHKLIAKGWSQRKTVVFLYGVTAFLAVMAVLIVNMRDVPAGLFILLLGGALILFVRTAGWFSFFALDKVAGWIRDISDEAGVSRGRRTFLNLQIEISQAQDVESLWGNVSEALDQLGFDLGEMTLATGMAFAHASPSWAEPVSGGACACRGDAAGQTGGCLSPGAEQGTEARFSPARGGEASTGEGSKGKNGPDTARPRVPGPVCFEWTREGLERDRHEYLSKRSLLKIELPLMDQSGRHMGTVWLVKNIADSPMSDFTLRRAEQLRRTMVSTLERLREGD